MDSSSVIGTASNGAAVEVATISHNGQEFTALGSVIDHESGYAMAYVGSQTKPCQRGTLTTWDGQPLGTYYVISNWQQVSPWCRHYAEPYTMASIRARLHDGSEWHGRFSADWSQLVKLRKCRQNAK